MGFAPNVDKPNPSLDGTEPAAALGRWPVADSEALVDCPPAETVLTPKVAGPPGGRDQQAVSADTVAPPAGMNLGLFRLMPAEAMTESWSQMTNS